MANKKPRYNEIFFTQEEENKIVKLYTDGMSTVKIGKLFNVCHKTIAKVLDKHRIKRVGNGRRKYSVDENYFDVIDTPNKAYTLGFLYADGSNCMTKGTVSMSLQEEDKEILESIRSDMKNEHPLEFIDYSNKNDFGYTYKNQYRMLICSIHICKSLEKIGMVPNKSLILQFPEIQDNLISHFIRGYFDGDGSVCFCSTNHNCLVTITSTEDFCLSVKDILEKTLNIHVSIVDASNKNGITKICTISGKNQVKTFLEYIYKDADMYLKRKFERYIEKYAA